ncbi:MAG: cell division protein FtsZ [Bacteroidetes bacterium]|nr:MAG: cell division protein FtsZ [Bacteroidota bacterium]
MAEDIINFDLPQERSSIIKVIGVGGGGSNAINYMYGQGITDVNFVVCNTDAQDLARSPVPVKIQLGETLTQGRGAGNNPEMGRQAAIESLDSITELLSHNTKMVFITAGMGGGTGTGAAPIIAKEAKENNILTVAIVTIPFQFEGKRRISQAVQGISELKEYVDSLLIINNEKLRQIYGNLPFSEAFSKADNVLTIAAKGIAEIITVSGNINVDFADVQTVMNNSGVALMGSAVAEGEDRALCVIQEALNSPLLNDNDIKGAKNILLNIRSGKDDEIRVDEIGQITDYLQDASGLDADIIWGNTLDESLERKISVTIIATGFNTESIPEFAVNRVEKKEKISLDEDLNSNIEFEVDNKVLKQKNVFSSAQRRIEFNGNDEVEKFDLEDSAVNVNVSNTERIKDEEINISRTKKEQHNIKNIKRNQVRYNNYRRTNNIEEYEDVPAYKRKEIELESYSLSSDDDVEVSRFTLSDDESGDNSNINKNNSYLFDNVD